MPWVWQLSMSLVENIYAMTKQFPDTEKFGLCSQMQRAAVSIARNLDYASENDPLLAKINELFAKLSALMNSIRSK